MKEATCHSVLLIVAIYAALSVSSATVLSNKQALNKSGQPLPTDHSLSIPSNVEKIAEPGLNKPLTLAPRSRPAVHQFIEIPSPPPTVPRFQSITCESHHYRTKVCHLPYRGIHFYYLHQRSRTKCVQNSNFWFRSNAITVARGCRATFFYLASVPSTQDIGCQSFHYRTAICNGRGDAVRDVRVIQRYSNTPCIKWFTYFPYGKGVKVTNGCRGKFRMFF